MGWSNVTPKEDLALVKELGASGAFVVGIGPKSGRKATTALLSEVDVHLDSSASAAGDATRPFGGEVYPLVSMASISLRNSYLTASRSRASSVT